MFPPAFINDTIRIPETLITDSELMSNQYGIQIFAYFASYRNSFNSIIPFSFNHMAEWLGGKEPTRYFNEKVMTALKAFEKKRYFLSSPFSPDFNNIPLSKPEKGYWIKANPQKFMSLPFAAIRQEELTDIRFFARDKHVTPDDLLLVLSYIRIHMNYNPDKPRCCYRFYTTIANDTGVCPSTYTRKVGYITNFLDKMHILKHEEPKRKYYEDSTGTRHYITSPKIFADYRIFDIDGKPIRCYNPSTEICKQIQELNKGWIWYNGKHSQDIQLSVKPSVDSMEFKYVADDLSKEFDFIGL